MWIFDAAVAVAVASGVYHYFNDQGEPGVRFAILAMIMLATRWGNVPAPFGAAFACLMLLATWASVEHSYREIRLADEVIHFLTPGSLAAAGCILLAHLPVMPDARLSHAHLRSWTPVFWVTVVGVFAAVLWEFYELGRGAGQFRRDARGIHRHRERPACRRARFPDGGADRPVVGRFASWTGTAPLDASSGEQTRHRLSRAGNRRMNHVLHIAAIVQIRHDTEGRAYYRRKLAAGKTPMEALRCLKRRSPTSPTASSSPTPGSRVERVREGTAGRLFNPARPTCTRSSTLRISHFPDPRSRR